MPFGQDIQMLMVSEQPRRMKLRARESKQEPRKGNSLQKYNEQQDHRERYLKTGKKHRKF